MDSQSLKMLEEAFALAPLIDRTDCAREEPKPLTYLLSGAELYAPHRDTDYRSLFFKEGIAQAEEIDHQGAVGVFSLLASKMMVFHAIETDTPSGLTEAFEMAEKSKDIFLATRARVLAGASYNSMAHAAHLYGEPEEALKVLAEAATELPDEDPVASSIAVLRKGVELAKKSQDSLLIESCQLALKMSRNIRRRRGCSGKAALSFVALIASLTLLLKGGNLRP